MAQRLRCCLSISWNSSETFTYTPSLSHQRYTSTSHLRRHLQSSNMASAPEDQQTFRFLDLPEELRCWVYDSIDFPTTGHVLDRAQSRILKGAWPVPPKKQVYDSRATLIRPHAPLEILGTCHLINEAARPILKRKMEHFRLQPVRYLVD